MELRQLNTFITIAQAGSFTQAAGLLGYAQSSVTTQIQLLEEELGVKLFERLGRNIFLTQAGETFIAYAHQIVKLAREAKEAVSTSDVFKGVIVVGSVESLCATRLPELYEAFHKRYPLVEVNIKIGKNDIELKEDLKENLIDLALLIECEPGEENLVTETELREEMVVLAAPQAPLTGLASVLPENFGEETLILTERTCNYRRIFEGIMHQAGVTPHSTLESGSIQAIKKFTMSGLGISFLPQIAVQEELDAQRLVALNWKGPEFSVHTRLVRHKDKWVSPVLQAFIDLAKVMLV